MRVVFRRAELICLLLTQKNNGVASSERNDATRFQLAIPTRECSNATDQVTAAMVVPIDCLADWRLDDDDFLAAFKLPGPNERCDALSKKNPMARENRILFYEASHTYTVDAIPAPRSVTGLVHAYQASNFDPMLAIEAMKRGKNWPVKMEEFIGEDGSCMSDEEICNVWQHRGRVASARGTLLHFHAECHLNGMDVEKPHSPEFRNFLLVAKALAEMGWRPYRTEVCLTHMGLCVCGQLDALFQNEKGELCILDWKNCKNVQFENPFRTLKEPLQHLADCNGNLYALQLNAYRPARYDIHRLCRSFQFKHPARYILESEYSYVVGGNLYLGVVHKCLPAPRLIRVPYMQEEMLMIAEDQIRQGKAVSFAIPGPHASFVLPNNGS